MADEKSVQNFGFVITKGPVESGLAHNLLRVAEAAQKEGKTVDICLMSDGAWLAKKGQKNPAHETLLRLMEGGAGVSVCREHLRASGISEEETVDGLDLAGRTFKVLVTKVMEEWDRAVVV
jgi:sulfur relay (sulfurtransferase) complex TusBCD TusD component (DsrE family)